MVYVAPEAGLSSQQAAWVLIDGQQRIATLSILLQALANVLGPDREIGEFSARKIRAYFLLNELENGDAHYKLLLSSSDRETLKAIIKGYPLPITYSTQVIKNLKYFEHQLRADNVDLDGVCRGIRRLAVVEISLSPADDNPQLIFESLNSKGRELSQSDLIRNYVLMRQDKEQQDHLYTGYWQPLEKLFRQSSDENAFDEFMRHFLTLRTRELLPRSDIYILFRRYVERPEFEATTSAQLLDEILRYAKHYDAITNADKGGPLPPKLRKALDDFQTLRANVVLPFLLEIHNEYVEHTIDEQSYLGVLRVIETFLVRRFVCGLSTNRLRAVFFRLLGRLTKAEIVGQLTASLTQLSGGSRMPRDDEFQRDLVTKPLYIVRRWAELILRRLETHENSEPPDFSQLSIEHIMPQTLSDDWKKALGTEAADLHAKWLHTLGNLTLTGYNPEYSNRQYLDKRDLEGIGLAASGLQLNKGFANISAWNSDAIRARARTLGMRAVKTWPIPAVSGRVARSTKNSLEDIKFLDLPLVRQLFDLLDERIHGLDPQIYRSIHKISIQYKFQKSVCDLIPQSKGIRIIINVLFAEILDPKRLTRDLTGKIHKGNGDVVAYLRRPEDIGHIMDLIKQALDKQL